jgi:hypothetical protein
MATGIFTEARLNGDRFGFAEASLDHPAEFCAPPLAPSETPAAADILLRQGTSIFIQPPDKSDVREIETSLGSRRKLIVVTAVGAVLFVGALACFFLSSAGEKPPTQSAESDPAVQSSGVAQVQVAPRTIPEPSSATPNAVAWPDLPHSVTVEASPQVAPAARTGDTATHQTVPPWEIADIVFLQRPGVNIRSTPSANGTVVGTARKGMRFEVTNREADWVQVESGLLKGWINSQFLAPNEPR